MTLTPNHLLISLLVPLALALSACGAQDPTVSPPEDADAGEMSEADDGASPGSSNDTGAAPDPDESPDDATGDSSMDDDGEPDPDPDGDGVTQPDDPRAPAEIDADLVIERSAGGGPTHQIRLRCGPDPSVSHDDPGQQSIDAEAACQAVAAAEFLVEGIPDDELCTQVYGGPETAHITGTIDGRPVDVAIDRTDGCGIDRWERLSPLLGDLGGPGGGVTS